MGVRPPDGPRGHPVVLPCRPVLRGSGGGGHAHPRHDGDLRAEVSLCVCVCLCVCVRARARTCVCVCESEFGGGDLRWHMVGSHGRIARCGHMPTRVRCVWAPPLACVFHGAGVGRSGLASCAWVCGGPHRVSAPCWLQGPPVLLPHQPRGPDPEQVTRVCTCTCECVEGGSCRCAVLFWVSHSVCSVPLLSRRLAVAIECWQPAR